MNVNAVLSRARPWVPSWHVIEPWLEGATVGELGCPALSSHPQLPLDRTDVRDVVRRVSPVGLSTTVECEMAR